MYPLKRNRRLRVNKSIRNLVKENNITSNDFLVPLFVVEGKGIKEEIPSMPNYFRHSLDTLEKEVVSLWGLGIKAVLLFVKVEDTLKDNFGKEAINPNGLMQRAIKTIKNKCPEILVMTDVALDPYSIYGHDGVVEKGQIMNDQTIEILAKMSISHANAGANFLAPSDMMDGRIQTIRKALERENFKDVGLMSYSVKYASSFYGPFRTALDSAPIYKKNIPIDKKTYQMDCANRLEAVREVETDINEGADIIMIKPGMAYLDIIRDVRNKFDIPIAAYQVSGEYAMIKAASEKGWLDQDKVMLETTMAFKRAGADIIASYFAKDIIKLIS